MEQEPNRTIELMSKLKDETINQQEAVQLLHILQGVEYTNILQLGLWVFIMYAVTDTETFQEVKLRLPWLTDNN